MSRSSLLGVGAVSGLCLTALIGMGGAKDQPEVAGQAATPGAAYAIGFDVGIDTIAQLSADEVQANADDLVRGFADAVHRAEPAMSASERRRVLATLEREVSNRLAESRLEEDPVFRAMAEANARRGKAFLNAFGERECVSKLEGGILYQSRTAGAGAFPSAESTVVISGQARLIDGTLVADMNRREMGVADMLPGGQIIAKGMRVGDRWIVAIPTELSFGLRGRTPDIGPNETLLMDVELIEIR